jgi:hypothetical protein
MTAILSEWRKSLNVIRVSSKEELAVVAKANLMINCHGIQPEALFLFAKTEVLEIKIHAALAVQDPFSVIHGMPSLQELELRFDESMERVDHFTPVLSNLKRLTIDSSSEIEFSPTAFDHLDHAEAFRISLRNSNEAQFETGLAPCFFCCSGVQLLKLNSKAVASITNLTTNGIVESLAPLSGLTHLTYTNDLSIDSAISFCQYTTLNSMTLFLDDLSFYDSGQLSCLCNLKNLSLNTITDGNFKLQNFKI